MKNDERFAGKPDSTEKHVNTRKGGYKVTEKYGKDDRAEWERHQTDHSRADKYTNPPAF